MANSTFTFGAQTQLKNCLDPEDAYDLSTKNYVDNKTNFNSITIDGVTIGTGQTTLTPYSFNLPPTQGGVGGVLTLDGSLNLSWDNSEYVAPVGKDYGSAGLNIYNSTGPTNIGNPTNATYNIVTGDTWLFAFQIENGKHFKNGYFVAKNGGNFYSFTNASTYVTMLTPAQLSGQSAVTFNIHSFNVDISSVGNELAIVALLENVVTNPRYMLVALTLSTFGQLSVLARTAITTQTNFNRLSVQIRYTSSNTYRICFAYQSTTGVVAGRNSVATSVMTITPATSTLTLSTFTTTAIFSSTFVPLVDYYDNNTLVLSINASSFYSFSISTTTLSTYTITQPTAAFEVMTVIGSRIFLGVGGLGTANGQIYVITSLSPFTFLTLNNPSRSTTINGFYFTNNNFYYIAQDYTTPKLNYVNFVTTVALNLYGNASFYGYVNFNEDTVFLTAPNFQIAPFTTSSGTLTKNGLTNVWNLNTIPLLARYRKVAFNVNSSTDTAIGWDTSDGNTTPFTFNSSTGAITNAGTRAYLVQVFVMVGFASNGTGTRVVYITKNGASTGTNRLTNDNRNAVSSDGTVITASTVTNMSIGDTLTVYCFQASGSALQVGGATSGMATGYSTLVNLIVF